MVSASAEGTKRVVLMVSASVEGTKRVVLMVSASVEGTKRVVLVVAAGAATIKTLSARRFELSIRMINYPLNEV
jgi:hypothetical protein